MAAQSLDLSRLRAALEREGTPWVMDETTMTMLEEDERRARLGANPPPSAKSVEQVLAEAKDGPPVSASAESVGAPAAYDLRNVGGRNFVTPVKNQGGCGSCVAFGTVAAMETTYRVGRGDANAPADFSEAQLFYCHGRAAGRNCSNGWWPDPALAACRDTGVTFEEYYPYTAGDQNCTGLNADWRNRLARVTGFRNLTSNPAAMKEWISTRGALPACFVVFQDFFSYRTGVYRHVSGAEAGGHCVTLIGYDDAQQCWIAKNSWGTGWGDGGFFRIAYGQCGIDTWGVFGIEAVTITAWRNDTRVQGLWTNEAERNAWAYLANLGWRKIAPTSDQVQVAMLAEMASAKAGNRPVNVFEDAGTIKQVYVL